IKAVVDRLGLPMDRVFLNMDRYGNTSAASIPLALDEAVQAGRLTAGQLVLLQAFGSGLTWATTLLRW
ncbi:MAG: 3-oxoacyl-[acyl-carrier-protein] synthase III C-terminal domain-containing protein, partial [Nitrospirales bacterium]